MQLQTSTSSDASFNIGYIKLYDVKEFNYSAYCKVSIYDSNEVAKLKLEWHYKVELYNANKFEITSNSAFIISQEKIIPNENELRHLVMQSFQILTENITQRRVVYSEINPLRDLSFEIKQVVNEIKEELLNWKKLI